jgi:hypothetical protein
LYINDELKKINNARLSRGENPLTKDELIINLGLNLTLMMDGEVKGEDKQRLSDYTYKELELAAKATPMWIKIAWFLILGAAVYGISKLFF